MRDHEEADAAAFVARAERVHALADGLQRVDVEAGVRLVEDRVLRREDRELQHLQALLLAAREAVVDVAAEERGVHVERVEPVEDELAKRCGREIARAHRLARVAQEVRDGDARDRGGILEREEQPRLRAFVGRELEQLGAVEARGPAEDLVTRVAGERERQRRLSASVRPHQRVHAARLDRQVDALEDLVVVDGDSQVARDQSALFGHGHGIVKRAGEKVKESLDYLRLPC